MRSLFTLSCFVFGFSAAGCISAASPKTGVVADVPAAVRASAEFIAVTVPNGGWHLAIETIYEKEEAVWILAHLRRDPGPAAQEIRVVRCEIPTGLPAKPRRVFIAGKTWAWKNDEPVEFVASLAAVEKNAGGARVLFTATHSP